jgi:hypothetical protein
MLWLINGILYFFAGYGIVAFILDVLYDKE